jgi:hypothetical protein
VYIVRVCVRVCVCVVRVCVCVGAWCGCGVCMRVVGVGVCGRVSVGVRSAYLLIYLSIVYLSSYL